MKTIKPFLVLFLFSVFACTKDGSTSLDRPNIIYILADDLGYGELGVYGQKLIETPNIDALAKNGIKFTQHYSGAPVCAPARCMLLTGMHTGHAPIRGNDEWASRGAVWNLDSMAANPNLEGQRPLPDSISTIAQLLKENGYATGIVGKWGLGAPLTNSIPNTKGFDMFCGYNCQRMAHTYYPPHLWKNREKLVLNNKIVPLNSNLAEGADANDPKSYTDFTLNDYAPDIMHQEALKFIIENKDTPFFLYYASPVPHVPLQAKEKWVKYYQEKFGNEEPYTGNSYYPNRTPNATYAAMISYLDEQVGEIVATLKEEGTYENTLIIFTSDNGPTYTGGVNPEYFESAQPFEPQYGRGKGFVYEGGIRVPMVASWPGHIKAGTVSDHISVFYDVMATIADILNVEAPKQSDGLSFLPALLGEANPPEHDYLYWEFPEYKGQQAIRKGDWKAIRQDIKGGNLAIELYNLKTDLTEQHNIAAEHPEIIKEMEAIFIKEHTVPAINKFKMAALGD
ncbi:arylsulfatase [Arcticibacterium luteifluviistationis]|uniref:N-acetylgalactosamine-6-sulfatase n=1 Tax=Arcticibacterium luteifluviistationis TaxID=1784714 RepID=A0A2Z4GBY1_9BACT|nr:arylsulfatase [Arcticibacterium luteifluviistationis]AWV98580.1 N-acetylgalactosamine-6-sulfatase [Arcticibacterium luteifluviistationis]